MTAFALVNSSCFQRKQTGFGGAHLSVARRVSQRDNVLHSEDANANQSTGTSEHSGWWVGGEPALKQDIKKERAPEITTFENKMMFTYRITHF